MDTGDHGTITERYEPGVARRTRRAAKAYRCDNNFAHHINPGDRYVRITIFPSADVTGGRVPYQARLCAPCGHLVPFDEDLA